METIVIAEQPAGIVVLQHQPRRRGGPDCPKAIRRGPKQRSGGSIFVTVTLDQAARVSVGETVRLGVFACSSCGEKFEVVMERKFTPMSVKTQEKLRGHYAGED